MRHMLKHPGFPDILGGYAVRETTEIEVTVDCSANDNPDAVVNELTDPFFMVMARRDVAANRLW